MSNWLWDDYGGHGKIHLANWCLVNIKKKEHGGLGIRDMKDLNLVLLGSWVKRFLVDEGKIWHNIIQQKHMRHAVNNTLKCFEN